MPEAKDSRRRELTRWIEHNKEVQSGKDHSMPNGSDKQSISKYEKCKHGRHRTFHSQWERNSKDVKAEY